MTGKNAILTAARAALILGFALGVSPALAKKNRRVEITGRTG